MMHKILAIGAAAIATAVMSQQPAQAQTELIGLLRYPTGMQELYVDKNIQSLKLDNDTKVTEIIIRAELPRLTDLVINENHNLTNLTLLAPIGTKATYRSFLPVRGTNLRKITILPEQRWNIEIRNSRENDSTPIGFLQIQIAEAKPHELRIWQVKDKQGRTKVGVFSRGGVRQVNPR